MLVCAHLIGMVSIVIQGAGVMVLVEDVGQSHLSQEACVIVPSCHCTQRSCSGRPAGGEGSFVKLCQPELTYNQSVRRRLSLAVVIVFLRPVVALRELPAVLSLVFCRLLGCQLKALKRRESVSRSLQRLPLVKFVVCL